MLITWILTAQIQICEEAIHAIGWLVMQLSMGAADPAADTAISIGKLLKQDPFLQRHRFTSGNASTNLLKLETRHGGQHCFFDFLGFRGSHFRNACASLQLRRSVSRSAFVWAELAWHHAVEQSPFSADRLITQALNPLQHRFVAHSVVQPFHQQRKRKGARPWRLHVDPFLGRCPHECCFHA